MRKIIVANWKMNGNKSLVDEFATSLTLLKDKLFKLIICPPFPLIDYSHTSLPSFIKIGAQDCHFKEKGAFTGDVSPALLKEIGCDYVLLGHSERRQIHNENDELIAKKVKASVQYGLLPIVCIGETLEQKQKGETFKVLSYQLDHSLPNNVECIIAYEPVWAIGTGLTPSLSDIDHVCSFIKQKKPFPLLYGGSVKEDTIKPIYTLPTIEGVLVGGASLNSHLFLEMIQHL